MQSQWIVLSDLAQTGGPSRRTLNCWAQRWHDAGRPDVARKAAGRWVIAAEHTDEFLAAGPDGPPVAPGRRDVPASDPATVEGMFAATQAELSRVSADLARVTAERDWMAEQLRSQARTADMWRTMADQIDPRLNGFDDTDDE